MSYETNKKKMKSIYISKSNFYSQFLFTSRFPKKRDFLQGYKALFFMSFEIRLIDPGRILTKNNAKVFLGKEKDVLDRYYKTAKSYKVTTVVRITADCPLIDHIVIDEVVDFYLSNDYDYVSNYGIPKTYPEGCTADVYTADTLNEVFQEAKKPSEREHINPYIWNRPEKYRSFRVDYKKDL